MHIIAIKNTILFMPITFIMLKNDKVRETLILKKLISINQKINFLKKFFQLTDKTINIRNDVFFGIHLCKEHMNVYFKLVKALPRVLK